MCKKIRFYFMGKYSQTVIDSQVFNWLEYLPPQLIETKLISIINDEADRIEVNEKMIREGFSYLQYKISKYPIIREFQLTAIVIGLFVNSSSSYQKIIQTRNSILWFIIPILRKFTKTKIISELRGLAVSEYIYNRDNSVFVKKRPLAFIKLREKTMIKNAHKVICVSDKMKNSVIRNYKIENRDKINVIPGVADSNFFYFCNKLRIKLRKIKHLESRRVFLYSGRLYRSWQKPELLFSIFKTMNRLDSSAYFIILTPDIEIAEKMFFKNHLDKKDFLIDFVSHNKLNGYLNIADFGLLIRDNKPINNEASPTKFSEYILSGLKVIISPNVGDFTEFVKKFDTGVVFENFEDLKSYQNIINTNIDISEKRRISKIGKKYLSKRSYVSTMKNILLG